MIQNKIYTLFIVIIVILLPNILLNQVNLKKSVLGNGATKSNSATNKINGTAGQIVIGVINNSTNYLNQGFWYTQQISGSLPIVGISEEYSVDSTSAVYTGKILSDGGNDISEKGILISKSPNPTLNDYLFKLVSSSEANEYTLKFEDLENSTKYYARAYATNIIGTSYSPAQAALLHDLDGISFDVEKGVANEDGNGDGIPDWAQNNVVSLPSYYSEHGYITIAVDPSLELIDVENSIQSENIREYFYPFGINSFAINASQVDVEIFYHGVESLAFLTYRKLTSTNAYEDYQNVEFSKATINGRSVAKVTLHLVDGGIGDADGIVNGVIYDPGGPAIAIPSINNLNPMLLNTYQNSVINIPFFNNYYLVLLSALIIAFYIKFRK